MDLPIDEPTGKSSTGLPFISSVLTKTSVNASLCASVVSPYWCRWVTAPELHTVSNSLPALLLLFLQKCLRFNPDATVWKAKQQVLCSLTESLRDVLNYGLFQPATDGHDAKFLEEERLLKEYPQSFEKGVPYLEVNVQLISHRFCYCEI